MDLKTLRCAMKRVGGRVSMLIAVKRVPVTRLIVAFSIAMAWGCGSRADLPGARSDDYVQTVSLFQSAVARIQIGEERGAEFRLMQAAAIAPGEPAIWYNLGLLALRSSRIDSAASYLEKARTLDPDNSAILDLSGHVTLAEGRTQDAEAFFRASIERDPDNLYAVYALSDVLGAGSDSAATDEALMWIDRIIESDPNNIAAWMEKVRYGLRHGDHSVVQESASRMADLIPGSVDAARTALTEFTAAMNVSPDDQDYRALETALLSYPTYQLGISTFRHSDRDIAAELDSFLRLENPPYGAFPADQSLNYTRASSDLPDGQWSWFGVPVLDEKGIPVSIGASGRTLQFGPDSSVVFSRNIAGSQPALHLVAPLDYDYDYRIDLALAGPGGFALLKQNAGGGYRDVTATLNLPLAVLEASYAGGWAIDLDSEGDMDLVLAVRGAAPIVLRNNGDGSFQQVPLFLEVRDVKHVVWLDADVDGDLDAFFLSRSGTISPYANRGAGRFEPAASPVSLPSAAAMTVADLNYDGYMDLLLLTEDGKVVQATPAFPLREWALAEVAERADLAATAPGFASLHTGDLDNSGSLDIVASVDGRTVIWLMDQEGNLLFHSDQPDLNVFEVMDLVGIGREDLVGFDVAGTPVQMMNSGDNDYKSRTIEQQTASALGDRRINSYGIGGRIEMKAGLHYQHRPINSPVVHFGLGDRTTVETARIHWPNGVAQSLFDLETDQAIIAREGLNASCPWLYTVNDDGVHFLEDFMMRSPLGFRLSQDEFMAIGDGEDRIKIDGSMLTEIDGVYELRLTAELWETIYVDRFSLVAVDYLEGTEFFLDETFSDPQPELDPIVMSRLEPLVGAWDEAGRDVTSSLLELDDDYVRGFLLGRNFGQAKEHVLEIDLGPAFDPAVASWLVADGWLRASTSAISLAISQALEPAVGKLELEYQNTEGRWIRSDMVPGIPWGTSKSLVLNLGEALPDDASSRIRLRTNLELYWDRISWALDASRSAFVESPLEITDANLRFRGFSVLETAERWMPDKPNYDQIASRKPTWLDPSGYYTRYGPVEELLGGADDRYAIMSPGDELVIRFAATDPPAEGWTRDFIVVASGWTKDGSPATEHSSTVLPLPSRAYSYPTHVVPLHEDPVYRRFSNDWETYHTRYVSRGFAQLNTK